MINIVITSSLLRLLSGFKNDLSFHLLTSGLTVVEVVEYLESHYKDVLIDGPRYYICEVRSGFRSQRRLKISKPESDFLASWTDFIRKKKKKSVAQEGLREGSCLCREEKTSKIKEIQETPILIRNTKNMV